jgi:CRISPR-associated protein Csm2
MMLQDKTYVNEAEKVMRSLQHQDRQGRVVIDLTTSKIRNLLSLVSSLYDRAQGGESMESMSADLAYLRVQFVYQSGREKAVKDFVQKANLLQELKAVQDSNNTDDLIRFCRYMEALVAYHKYLGGKD